MNKTDCIKPFNLSKKDALNAPGYLLWQLTHVWQRKMKENLEVVDLTHVQFALLKGLFKAQKENMSMTQVELANELQTNIMMTSQVLRTLEKKGFVKRIPHPTDTRAKCVALTEKGNEIIEKAFDIMKKANTEFFKPIEKDMDIVVEMWLKLIKGNS